MDFKKSLLCFAASAVFAAPLAGATTLRTADMNLADRNLYGQPTEREHSRVKGSDSSARSSDAIVVGILRLGQDTKEARSAQRDDCGHVDFGCVMPRPEGDIRAPVSRSSNSAALARTSAEGASEPASSKKDDNGIIAIVIGAIKGKKKGEEAVSIRNKILNDMDAEDEVKATGNQKPGGR